MNEYTSLEVSERLAAAGFEAPEGCDTVGYPFKWLERAPGDVDFVEGWHGAESGDGPIAYRADTLLMWLLSLDVKEVAEKMGVRTLAENGDRGCLRIEQTRIDFKGTLAYVVQLHRPVEMGAQGPVLVDALGQLVCAVLSMMKKETPCDK